MARLTFRGGVHPPRRKSETQTLAITELPLPDQLIWPLEVPPGTRFLPVVQKGDRIRAGQIVARTADGFPLHASASGTIAAIGPRPYPGGPEARSLVLRVSEETGVPDGPGAAGRRETEHGHESFLEKPAEELRRRVLEAGVTDTAAGAGFPEGRPNPTANAFPSGPRVPNHTVVVNAMESEPSLASDHRLLVERSAEIVLGLRLTMRITGCRKGMIAVPSDNRGPLRSLRKAVRRLRSVSILYLDPKYPGHNETALLASLGLRTASSGSNPGGKKGVHVQSVTATLAVTDAVTRDLPQIRRVITVAGNGIRNPRNLSVPLGTPISACVSACGGYVSDKVLLIHGGPMAGVALSSDAAPVTAWTTGLTVLDGRDQPVLPETACIRCGRCSDCCPAGLAPYRIEAFLRSGREDLARLEGIASCIRCGSCTYICPAGRPLVRIFHPVPASGREA
ncbi:RnfABCDGE type electron transport complex subunit C [bacterium]|nr:RnfABCDGE type electron transport complex subunit C [bacterium]